MFLNGNNWIQLYISQKKKQNKNLKIFANLNSIRIVPKKNVLKEKN